VEDCDSLPHLYQSELDRGVGVPMNPYHPTDFVYTKTKETAKLITTEIRESVRRAL